jgi:hypothetical protein
MRSALFPPARPFSTGGSSGGGFFSRITSFLVGAGLMALGTQFYLYQELRDGNKQMLKKQQDLERRLAALEK